jgi:type VI secretion system secreted protein VgrG
MISQAQRFAFVTCPLGENTLLFHQMTGHEEMGRLFEYEIELLSEQQHIDINKVLGQPMTLTLELPKNKRDYHGYVTQFRQHGTLGEFFKYRAVLRPWLWFLTRHSHCRIFQELSIPDILKQVFQTHGFSDVELNLSQSYPLREYCVQYRETDFNFVSRLMEQEGMYYFFTHQPNQHTLVIADSGNAYQTVPDYDKIEFFPEENVEQREVEHIFQWDTHHEMQAGSYTLNDFDFKKPQADL